MEPPLRIWEPLVIAAASLKLFDIIKAWASSTVGFAGRPSLASSSLNEGFSNVYIGGLLASFPSLIFWWATSSSTLVFLALICCPFNLFETWSPLFIIFEFFDWAPRLPPFSNFCYIFYVFPFIIYFVELCEKFLVMVFIDSLFAKCREDTPSELYLFFYLILFSAFLFYRIFWDLLALSSNILYYPEFWDCSISLTQFN